MTLLFSVLLLSSPAHALDCTGSFCAGSDLGGDDLIVGGYGTIEGTFTNVGTFTVTDYAKVSPGTPLEVHAQHMEIVGYIDAYGAGESGGAGYGKLAAGAGPGGGAGGRFVPNGGEGGGGGGYGGSGGGGGGDGGVLTLGGGTYGSEDLWGVADANLLGSGGGGAGGGSGGGNGGGAVWLSAPTINFVAGSAIDVRGLSSWDPFSGGGGGGGSGGSITLVANTVTGVTALYASGGNGGNAFDGWSGGGGGGGGGRLKFVFAEDKGTLERSVDDGPPGYGVLTLARAGVPGTIYVLTLDTDGDGETDPLDPCPDDADDVDADADGIPDVCDNCPSDANADQADADADAWGAACDCDDANASVSPGAIEVQGDNIDNDCNGFTDGDDPSVGDADSDGLTDGEERAIGTNPSVGDSDLDGIPDAAEVGDLSSPTDTDGDGLIDAVDDDDDNDTVPTLVEGAADFDRDGLPNYLDPDSDGDGAGDGAEGTDDSDGDGVPDFLDPGGAAASNTPTEPTYGYGLGCTATQGLGSPASLLLSLAAIVALGFRRRAR